MWDTNPIFRRQSQTRYLLTYRRQYKLSEKDFTDLYHIQQPWLSSDAGNIFVSNRT